MKTLLAISAILLSASPVFAQTAEETVAFMIGGMEDKATFPSEGVIGTIKQISESPASFVFKVSERNITFTVISESSCVYNIDVGPGSFAYKLRLDFSRATAPLFGDNITGVLVKRPGLKCNMISGSDRCSLANSDEIKNVTLDRLKKAYQYFSDNFCKARAF